MLLDLVDWACTAPHNVCINGAFYKEKTNKKNNNEKEKGGLGISQWP